MFEDGQQQTDVGLQTAGEYEIMNTAKEKLMSRISVWEFRMYFQHL